MLTLIFFQFHDCDFELRTSHECAHHCDLIEKILPLASHTVVVLFSVVEGALIPDTLHDVLEDVLSL